MHRQVGFRIKFIVAAACFLAAATTPWAAEATGKTVSDIAIMEDRRLDGIRLIAIRASADAAQDISVLAPADGLERISGALRLVIRKSPTSARIISRLKAAGRVSLIYYPNNFRDRNRLNTQTVALFLPDFLKGHGIGSDGREFVVVINQFGVKWPVAELAAVIVHELAGHGLQHLQDRIASGRLLDLECEASLYQEQAYQDFGVVKKARVVVLFRRQMENRYCADFRGFMRDRMPNKLALWDTLNPEVPALLGLFRDYRGNQTARNAGNAGSLSSRSR